MTDAQGDLFSGGGFASHPASAPIAPEAPCETLDDERLIAGLDDARLARNLAICAEVGRRKLAAAVPVLESLCRRFHGYGASRIVPEQAAAIAALTRIGGKEAAAAVARLIVRGVVQGPGLNHAVGAAAALSVLLPPECLRALLGHDDPSIRANACRCVAPRAARGIIECLDALLDDLHAPVREAAALALGRLGREEARDGLIALLRRQPSPEAVEAITSIADEDCVILLGRLARRDEALRPAVLAALDAIDHWRATQIAASLREPERRREQGETHDRHGRP